MTERPRNREELREQKEALWRSRFIDGDAPEINQIVDLSSIIADLEQP